MHKGGDVVVKTMQYHVHPQGGTPTSNFHRTQKHHGRFANEVPKACCSLFSQEPLDGSFTAMLNRQTWGWQGTISSVAPMQSHWRTYTPSHQNVAFRSQSYTAQSLILIFKSPLMITSVLSPEQNWPLGQDGGKHSSDSEQVLGTFWQASVDDWWQGNHMRTHTSASALPVHLEHSGNSPARAFRYVGPAASVLWFGPCHHSAVD